MRRPADFSCQNSEPLRRVARFPFYPRLPVSCRPQHLLNVQTCSLLVNSPLVLPRRLGDVKHPLVAGDRGANFVSVLNGEFSCEFCFFGVPKMLLFAGESGQTGGLTGETLETRLVSASVKSARISCRAAPPDSRLSGELNSKLLARVAALW